MAHEMEMHLLLAGWKEREVQKISAEVKTGTKGAAVQRDEIKANGREARGSWGWEQRGYKGFEWWAQRQSDIKGSFENTAKAGEKRLVKQGALYLEEALISFMYV